MAEPVKLFRTELRRLREQAGFSLGHLADTVHYSKGYLSKIETGVKPAPLHLAHRCDTALGAGGALAALAARPPGSQLSTQAADDHESWIMEWDGDGQGSFAVISRRQAMGAGAASVLGWSLDRPAARTASRDDLTAQRTLFAHLRELGRTTSPAVVLPMAICQTYSLRSLATAARSPAAWLLAAQHAEYAGWMTQELGNDAAAGRWIDLALSFAEAAGDHDLPQYAMVRRANLTLYQGDAAQTVELAQRAQQDSRASARVHELAARREAQGWALAGDEARCGCALDRAEELAGAGPGADGIPLGSGSDLDYQSLVTAWCSYDLGRTRASAELFDQALAHAGSTRATARFQVRRALAHAAERNIEEASQITEGVLTQAAAVDSATIRIELRALARALSRWSKDPVVRSIAPALESSYRGRSS